SNTKVCTVRGRSGFVDSTPNGQRIPRRVGGVVSGRETGPTPALHGFRSTRYGRQCLPPGCLSGPSASPKVFPLTAPRVALGMQGSRTRVLGRVELEHH